MLLYKDNSVILLFKEFTVAAAFGSEMTGDEEHVSKDAHDNQISSTELSAVPNLEVVLLHWSALK